MAEGSPRCPDQVRRSIGASRRFRLLALLLCMVLLLALPGPAMAAGPPQRWSLSDSGGRGWGLTLFEQPDPAYPQGWRLRLNADRPDLRVDHDRPLEIRDGFGGSWTLRNRSPELVPPGEAHLPAGSAQFDADELVPRPSDALPLRLAIPLVDGHEATVTLGPDVAAALHQLPSQPPEKSTH